MKTSAQGRTVQINQLIKILEAQVNGSLDIQQARKSWERALDSHAVDIIAEALAIGMPNFQIASGQHGVAYYAAR